MMVKIQSADDGVLLVDVAMQCMVQKDWNDEVKLAVVWAVLRPKMTLSLGILLLLGQVEFVDFETSKGAVWAD
jgi:hypothetical protein